jgi:hypothetical protein
MVGCADNPAPPISDGHFDIWVNQCAQEHNPITTEQLLRFAGKPDKLVLWGNVRTCLSQKRQFDKEKVEHTIIAMQRLYSANSEIDKITNHELPMDRVEVWLYMWEQPGHEKAINVLDPTTSELSVYALTENNKVLAVGVMLYP